MTARTEALRRSYEMQPLEGNAEGISQHATRYSQLAGDVGRAVGDLKTAIADTESHESEAMTELAAQADEVVPRLAQIQGRYETAGTVLGTYAGVLAEAQGEVERALRTRDSIADDVERYDVRIREAEGDVQLAAPEDRESRRDDLTRLVSAVEPLTQELVAARAHYDAAVATAEDSGARAEQAIAETVEADGLTDSAWDSFKGWVTENMGWIKALKDAMSIITTALGILSIFFPVLLPFAAGFALATLAMSSTLAATGNGSWLDVGLDAVALLTLGVGAALGSGVKLTMKAVRVTRSARLAWAGSRRPGVLGAVLRPARARLRYGDATARVTDDLARSMPRGVRLENMQLVGRPTYRSLEDVARVFKGGGVDGTAFVSVARNATVGSGGFVDNALLGAGRNLSQMSLTNNIVGLADSAVSWHDDAINGNILNIPGGLRDVVPDEFGGDALGRYGDWWAEVDGATYDVAGQWDPAGKS
ncbi:hypothetical protein [Isoptericola cucumis]|uniref:Uncharacterized protein n=1 Tax=Isoptericola cucumis TaxID=1776856 RepID=A0ABQ2BCU6_9MICO|nr:hypothetical protein [Isoptericola cucumis]GGI11085.1 hypothetical protein GCM10007368_34450 [Isoptericola cucumis]